MHRTIVLAVALVASATVGFSPSHEPDVSPRAVVEAKFAAVNRHDVPAIVRLYAPEAQVNASDYCKPRTGQSEVQRIYESMFSAYPDVVVDVSQYVVEGDQVAVRMKVKIHVAGQMVEIPIADFFTVRNGRIVSDDGYFDVHGRPCTT